MSFLLTVYVFPNDREEITPARRPSGADSRGGLLPPPGARAGNCRLATWAGTHLWPGSPTSLTDAGTKVAPTVTAESVLDVLLCRTLLKLTRADGGPRRGVTPPNKKSDFPSFLGTPAAPSGSQSWQSDPCPARFPPLGAQRQQRARTRRLRGPAGRLDAQLSLRTAAQALLF